MLVLVAARATDAARAASALRARGATAVDAQPVGPGRVLVPAAVSALPSATAVVADLRTQDWPRWCG
ncbi:MAG: hypothetical protein M3N98_07840 [Actinomycetota bacterium]|nr:hypothetical protein [Actinomycetota bacterium]